MRALGFDVKKPDVLKILKDYDREASGKISFEDFQEVSKYLRTSNYILDFFFRVCLHEQFWHC